MELDVFISETLKSIIKGINETKDFESENGAVINPHLSRAETEAGKVPYTFIKKEEGARSVNTIDFDIAVTTSSSKESGIKGGINVISLNLGSTVSDKGIDETASRIKFTLRVLFPNTSTL